jgi:F0F1-type ATP synthase membrane subunit a
LGLLSTALIGMLSKTVAVPLILLALAVLLFMRGINKGKLLFKILGICMGILSLVGLLEYTGLMKDIPIFQYGIPAVLSLYFDLFSGFVQAFVFSLLSMVYIAAACPPPVTEETNVKK